MTSRSLVRRPLEVSRGITANRVVAGVGCASLALPFALAAAGRLDLASVTAAAIPLLAVLVAGVLATESRPDHPAARRLLLVGAIVPGSFALSAVLQATPADLSGSAPWVLCIVALALQDLGFAVWLDLLARFPDGSVVPERLRYLIGFGYIAAGFVWAMTALRSSADAPLAPSTPGPTVSSPLPDGLTHSGPALDSFLYLLVAAGTIVVIARYARSSPEQRMQIRWPLAATVFILVVVAVSAAGLLSFVPEDGLLAQVIWGLVLSTLPLSLMVGMIKYRLFDLDLVLRRSLVYGLLWAAIAVLYVAAAAMLGITAGHQLPLAATIVVTIAAAMAFQPARVQLERLADRLVFGRRMEGHELIRVLGATLEASVPPEHLAAELAHTIASGLDARWVKVAIAQPPVVAGADAIAAHPATALQVDLPRSGGRIECGPRRRGEYTPSDVSLLDTLAQQAALALDHARLNALLQQRVEQIEVQARQLAASRSRLVEAEAAERRRIERNIHDGVQQQLVALMAKLSVARAQLGHEPDEAARTLSSMQGEFRTTLADLRDLASGIHPHVLQDRGLRAAVEALASRLPLGIQVDCRDGTAETRFDERIEAAAYFCIAEAFTNAIKHGEASQATVRLAHPDRMLVVQIDDDGRGIDHGVSGRARGIQGLHDRVDSLGGTLMVSSIAGGGARVLVQLPERRPNAD